MNLQIVTFDEDMLQIYKLYPLVNGKYVLQIVIRGSFDRNHIKLTNYFLQKIEYVHLQTVTFNKNNRQIYK